MRSPPHSYPWASSPLLWPACLSFQRGFMQGQADTDSANVLILSVCLFLPKWQHYICII